MKKILSIAFLAAVFAAVGCDDKKSTGGAKSSSVSGTVVVSSGTGK